MNARASALTPANFIKAFGVIGVVSVLLFAFLVVRIAPLWLLLLGMFVSISGALAWPPKTFRTVSVWVLWAGTAVALVSNLLH